MDFFKAQFDRIQQQLNGLNSSQKMLTFTLVAIMAMSMLWWVKYAGTAEMEPVLNQAFSEDDVARITTRLASKGIAYKTQGDKILVPADRKFEVLADLGYSQLLPRDTRTGFDEISKVMSPWDPSSKTEAYFNRAREMTLSQVIRNFPQVATAVVMIDPTLRRSFDTSTQPSATVNITMRDGVTANKQLVNAAADVVAGAQAGLSRGRIKVIVNGISMAVTDRGEDGMGGMGGPDDIIGLMQQWERYHASKVSEQLSFIRGVIVAVTVDLNTKSVREQKKAYDPTNSVQKELQTKTRTEETTSSSPASGEPGTGSNVSMSIAGLGGSGGSTSTVSEESTTFDVKIGESSTITNTPAGSATVIAATVRVPLSYFTGIWMSRNPGQKEPDEKALEPLIAMELPKIKNDVMKCTGIKDAESVSAETYADVLPLLASVAPSATATSTATVFVGNYSKQIALGVLALVSLFMVLMMARKASPLPAVVDAEDEEPPPQLHNGESITGEAIEGNGTLDGMELDDDAVKAQQMLDQVSTLVKENPEAAANLVNRWLTRS